MEDSVPPRRAGARGRRSTAPSIRALHYFPNSAPGPGRPLLAFEFGPDGLSLSTQRLDADLHASRGRQQLRGFGKGGQPAQQGSQCCSPPLVRCLVPNPRTDWSGSQLCPHPRRLSRTRGMCTVPQRLVTVRGLRRRRTACSECTPHSGHAGLRGPAALASWPSQVASRVRPSFSSRSSRAYQVAPACRPVRPNERGRQPNATRRLPGGRPGLVAVRSDR